MQNWSKSTAATRHLGFLIFDEFSNHGLANLMEPFRAANRLLGRQAYRWDIMTPNGGQVVSSSGLPISPTLADSAVGRGDKLFVVSSYGEAALATAQTRAKLRAMARRYPQIVAIDTGSWLLAAAGLLDQRRATIHFELLDHFSEYFSQVSVERAAWVRDGAVVTCGGAMAGFDLACTLIAEDHGTALVLDIQRLFMSDTAVSARPTHRLGRDRYVDRGLSEMGAHLEKPLTISQLARRVGCTQRSLEQRFQRQFSATPRKVYRRLRLDHAKRLLQQDEMTISEVALRSGYANPSAFTRAFRAEFGQIPRDLR